MSNKDQSTSIVVHRSANFAKGDRIVIGGDIRTWTFGFRFWRWQWTFSMSRQPIHTVAQVDEHEIKLQ